MSPNQPEDDTVRTNQVRDPEAKEVAERLAEPITDSSIYPIGHVDTTYVDRLNDYVLE